jgi:hypothetical protein
LNQSFPGSPSKSFFNSIGQKQTNHSQPKSTVVRCCPKADKICGAAK